MAAINTRKEAPNKKGTLYIEAGMAKPGASLAGYGIDMPKFCREFNEKTKDMQGPVTVLIYGYKDRSYDFLIKTPPSTFLLKKAAKIEKGSNNAKTTKVATLSNEQIEEIAKIKMPDLNAYDLESAIKIVKGTAKNMGIKVEGE